MADNRPYIVIQTREVASDDSESAATDGDSKEIIPDVHAGSTCTTHDTSRTSFHIKDLGLFARKLQESVARAFPNKNRTTQRYQNVRVLLLHWEWDDLFVMPELEDLEKCLRMEYAFDTERFAIPSKNSHLELMSRIVQLLKEYESPDTLFIIYYGGHASIDAARQSAWCANRHPAAPRLQWSAIQTLLERTESDVLILMDCCAGAASAAFPTGASITETISASGWGATAPDPGRHSFTNALIEVLHEWRTRTFSAAMLHAELLARLKHPRPVTINGKNFESRTTPVHFMMTSNHKAPSIEISKLISRNTREPKQPNPPCPYEGHVRPSIRQETDSADERADATSIPKNPTHDTPHVLISLALEGDQELDINAWDKWLSAVPGINAYVKVQGVFKSHSTLVLASLPVMIWDMLPEDPAISFISFIRSDNLIAPPKPTDGSMLLPSKPPIAGAPSTEVSSFAWFRRRTIFGLDAHSASSMNADAEELLGNYYSYEKLSNDVESALIASTSGN